MFKSARQYGIGSYLQYTYYVQLARQLSPADKRRLAKLLEKEAIQTETTPSDDKLGELEAQLTPGQRKTWATIKQGFDELAQIR